jgi:hypothetical protein
MLLHDRKIAVNNDGNGSSGSPDNPADEGCPWVAVSPDGERVVTGQWDPMQTVIVYP